MPGRVGINFNDGGALSPEMPEHIFRNAAADAYPVPPVSSRDLAQGVVPVVIDGAVHPLSGPPQKMTDGSGASSEDDPANAFFFDNGVPVGRFCISLGRAEPIRQINLFAWHRNSLSGGLRAPLKINVFASDGAAPGFKLDNPLSPGYVLLAQVDTVRPGGVSAQSGQHGASIFPVSGPSLGTFRHFLFEVLPPVDGLCHTFISEIDLVPAPAVKLITLRGPSARYFDEHIGPLLARRCLDCHNAADQKGGLDLSSAETATTGGDSGAAFVPGNPQESLLTQRVIDDEMPPKHPLTDQEKQLLREWIAAGAIWGSSPIERFQFTSGMRAGYDWWALQPLVAPEPPNAQSGGSPDDRIDRFVLAGLAAVGLKPAPPADRRTLIRRVSFDLTGLPPTPQEVAEFVNDDKPDAYERLVDRLLASPHYGETWGRHWLDIVRFSESEGFERNKFHSNAWKYRDWVIQAFNDNLPYDEFVRLQLAGDIVHPDDPTALVAAGYLVQAPYDLLGSTQGSQAMRANTREDELENLVGNLAQTFLGLTVHCARCHDHKFDPLHQTEYFQFASAVGGLRRNERELRASAESASAASALAAKMEGVDGRLAQALGESGAALLAQARREGAQAAEAALQAAQAAVNQAEKKVEQSSGVDQQNAMQVLAERRRELQSADDLVRAARGPQSIRGWDNLFGRLSTEQRAVSADLIVQLSRLDVAGQLHAGGAIQSFESTPPQFFHLLTRGNFRQPAEVVTASGLACIPSVPADWGLSPASPEAQRRLKLARWMTDPRNPLPARVIVNRLWHYHFGVGLVDTPSDFGFNGGRPSHPGLLDWLASQLIANRWSLKAVQREILLSAAFRRSSELDPSAAKIDAGNRLLWRKTPQRLEAEAVRDAVLAVCGALNRRMGGPSFRDMSIDTLADNIAYSPTDVFDSLVNRRSVYRTVVRAAAPVLLESLDCADPNVATPRRTVTTTPLQALSLLNNPFMRQAAKALTDRVRQEVGPQIDRQIDYAYQLALGRAATTRERESAGRFVLAHGLAEFCLVIFNSNEFLYID